MSSTERGFVPSVVILAAGAGTRMKSKLPKPLHPIAGRPMLHHVLTVARELEPADITIVGSPELVNRLETVDWVEDVHLVTQDPPAGTGDAVKVALNADLTGSTVLVLYADHPLITKDTLSSFIAEFDPARDHVAVMTCLVEDAAGYGRIERDANGQMVGIVENVDDDPAKRRGGTEINSGVVALDRSWAAAALARLQPNPRKNELFLTDLVGLAASERTGSAVAIAGPSEVLIGINDRVELAAAEAELRARKRVELMQSGVTLIHPDSNAIDLDVEIGMDSVIGPGCILESGTRIGRDCRIGPNAILRAVKIGDRVRVESSTIESSTVLDDSDVGPYAHIREKTRIGKRVHIGNFAELKHALVGDESRIGHFSYTGDATLGKDVNIGAGSITCNFDGTSKHRATIGEGAFIGSDTLLIAPIEVGAYGRTGAGAVVSRDVAEGALVVGMPAREVHRMSVEEAKADRKEQG